MSMRSPMRGHLSGFPALPEPPSGLPVGSYPTYAEAQQAVDHLSDQKFPVEHVTIVGTDLKLVERVTGRMTTGRATGTGATAGAYWGVFVGLLMMLFGPNPLLVLLISVVIGALFGALFGYVSYRATGGHRDFTSSTQVVAGTYELLCQPRYAEDARAQLAHLSLRTGNL